MAGTGYAFITAYLKGEEAKILSLDHLNSVLKATELQEVVDSLRETDLGDYLNGYELNTFDEVDELLWKYFGECLSRIEWFKNVPSDAIKILTAYTARYDILNMKTAIQNILTGVRNKGIPAGMIYRKGYLDELLSSENLEEISSVANACGLAKYSSIIREYRTDDGFRKEILTDTGMENIYFKDLQDTTKRLKDGSVLLKVFQTMQDMTNLQIVLRAVINESDSDASGKTVSGGYLLNDETIRELLNLKTSDISSKLNNAEIKSIVEDIISDYEKSGDISAVDEHIERSRFRIYQENLSPRIMSPAVVIWYMIQKEVEIRNVRLILKSVLDDINLDEIKDYLVLEQ